jgi:hypothetical protein
MAARKTPSKGGKPDKIMRDALMIELHRDDIIEGKKIKRFRQVAEAMVQKAIGGDGPVMREIFDRMDGKVPQALVGDDTQDPIRMGEPTDEQRARALEVFMAKNAGKVP